MRVVWYHDNSVEQALYDLFPDVKFDKSKMNPEKISSDFRMCKSDYFIRSTLPIVLLTSYFISVMGK